MKVESVRRRLFFSQIHRVGKVVAASVLLGVGVAITAQAQVINLNPGDSVNLSQLLGPNADSVQVGDKLFADFSFQYGDTGGNLASYLQPNAISVTGLSNPTGYGISFSGPLAAIGDITKDLVLRYSVAVTDPTRLISDVHLSYNGTVLGNGFSSVVEEIFTGGFGGQKIAQLEVLNPGNPNPVFQDLVVLLQPREKLFVQKDIMFGGGGLGSENRALLSIIDQNFSEIPEPSTLVLSGAGCVALLVLKRRK
jgi:hypothetical protein